MKEFLQRAICGRAGVAVGILLCQFFWGPNHELDWGRALFTGVFAGIVAALFW
jgi:hypothetical protein